MILTYYIHFVVCWGQLETSFYAEIDNSSFFKVIKFDSNQP